MAEHTRRKKKRTHTARDQAFERSTEEMRQVFFIACRYEPKTKPGSRHHQLTSRRSAHQPHTQAYRPALQRLASWTSKKHALPRAVPAAILPAPLPRSRNSLSAVGRRTPPNLPKIPTESARPAADVQAHCGARGSDLVPITSKRIRSCPTYIELMLSRDARVVYSAK